MVSSGFIYDFFRVHLGFHVVFFYQDFFRVSLGFTYGLSRVSFRIQTEQNKAKEHEKQRDSKDRKQRSKGAGSRAAKTHD